MTLNHLERVARCFDGVDHGMLNDRESEVARLLCLAGVLRLEKWIFWAVNPTKQKVAKPKKIGKKQLGL